MSYSSMAALDAADERELRREAAREKVRNGGEAADIASYASFEIATPPQQAAKSVPATPEPKPAPAVKPPGSPSPAMMPAHASGPTEPTPPPFRIVGPTLPTAARGRGYEAPPIRMQAIACAIENPGLWIEYRSSAGDAFKSPSTIVTQARNARGGFRKGFTAKTIRGIAYIRYDTPTTEGTPE